jgi:predicted small lipoprotein YifL
MRFIAMVLALAMMISISGCAKKSASEQLADDAKKAADQMNKDVKNLFK